MPAVWTGTSESHQEQVVWVSTLPASLTVAKLQWGLTRAVGQGPWSPLPRGLLRKRFLRSPCYTVLFNALSFTAWLQSCDHYRGIPLAHLCCSACGCSSFTKGSSIHRERETLYISLWDWCLEYLGGEGAGRLQRLLSLQHSKAVVVVAAVVRQNAFPCFVCKNKANSCARLIATGGAFRHWKKKKAAAWSQVRIINRRDWAAKLHWQLFLALTYTHTQSWSRLKGN